MPANGGLATFTSATLKKTGKGFTLSLAASGLPSATTSTFKVVRTVNAASPKTKPAGRAKRGHH
jgi:hypothetical protein